MHFSEMVHLLYRHSFIPVPVGVPVVSSDSVCSFMLQGCFMLFLVPFFGTFPRLEALFPSSSSFSCIGYLIRPCCRDPFSCFHSCARLASSQASLKGGC
jgi:hypothetical protein